MANTYKISGKAKWAKVHTPDDKYGTYQICVYMDKKAEKTFVQSGCQGQIKEDEDGRFYNFKRRPQVLSRKGKLLDFGPPKVLDKDGKETSALIGNGSDVTIEIETYMTEKGVGTRLNSVTIDNLVEYKRKEDNE